jgi:ABC-type Fe3+-hydroxamate transport system substrate-binding protein
VSLVPSWTETLFSFGLESLVGVTRFCVHPKELVERCERVGGTKDPKLARIIELRPDLVVCEHEENRKEDVEALRAAGIEVWLSEVKSIDDSLREVLSLGATVGREDAAEALAARIEAALHEVTQARPARPIDVYVPIWRKPWMTLTNDTYAHHLLAVAGARNVFGEAEGRYPERTPEEAIESGARAALLPSEPFPFAAKHVPELVEAGFPEERVMLLDGEALTWYGAREVEGLRTVAAAVRALGPRS